MVDFNRGLKVADGETESRSTRMRSNSFVCFQSFQQKLIPTIWKGSHFLFDLFEIEIKAPDLVLWSFEIMEY